MSEEHPYLSIVIPLFNEEGSLQPLSEELKIVLEALQRPYEIIFVDDGSTDGSFDALQKLHDADPDHIRVTCFRRNFGKTAALSVGFGRARGQVVVTMDADLQDDPHEVPKLLHKLDEGFDLVAAWRERRQDPLSKTLPSRLFNGAVALLTGLKLHDFNCGFKAYRLQVVRELKLYGDQHRFIPVLASWQGFRVGEVSVTHRPRRFGQSKYGWQRYARGFFDFLVVLFLTHYLRRPLQLFGTLGLFCLLIGFVVGLYLTYLRFFGPGIGWRPALFFDVMAIVVGVQLISIGLLGEMLRNFGYRSEDEYSIRTEL
jgi:glycosyltransferase involved in cell wall biosynthesis